MKRQTVTLALLTAGGMSLALFGIKYQVRDLEKDLDSLNRTIARDQQAIHVLKAEWNYLNDPRRLNDLAGRHLGLKPTEMRQLGTLEQLPPRPETAAPPEKGQP
ncbi:MAG: hypothetical protein H7841_08680 [Magnetospirillum sp. WYHS-4]